MYFSFEHLQMRYEPYPVGIAKPLMDENAYKEFVEKFPPLELFESHRAMGKPHDKYTLSEKENERKHYAFIKSDPLWRDFHSWITSDEFVLTVLEALVLRHVDLGYSNALKKRSFQKRVKEIIHGHFCSCLSRLRARFEFSALPADGGFVLPHTDSSSKIVTLIVAMVQEGEWNPEHGGGTDINKAKSDRYRFNYVNQRATFEDMDVVDSYDYGPNQAVLFVKTYDSWHAVRPMTGKGSSALRKTLTINIMSER